MILIEFYDKTPVENLITTLTLKPRKTVFIAADRKKAWHSVGLYKKITAGRGLPCEMEVIGAPRTGIDESKAAILSIIDSNPRDQIVIDIAGGSDCALVAAGMVFSELGGCEKRLHAFYMNPATRRGTLIEFIRENDSLKTEKNVYDFSFGNGVYLTCEENIILHGGSVAKKGATFKKDSPLCDDVERLWEMCRHDPAGWNAKTGRLSAESAYADESGLRAIPRSSIGEDSGSRTGKKVDIALWNALVDGGLIVIDETRSGGGSIFFRYKNRIVDECLNKSGTILEYRTFLAGIRAERDNLPLYDSVETGIVISWNEYDSRGGTQNEIDCMLMNGVCPVFISCKNGDIKTEELYKLGTVSERFGSDYAKKYLLSTVYFDESLRRSGETIGKAAATLKERAKEMDIRLLSKAHTLNKNSFDAMLEKLV